jgi:hypothetical protein
MRWLFTVDSIDALYSELASWQPELKDPNPVMIISIVSAI